MESSGKNFNKNQIFEDISRMASGAVGAFSGFREHMEQEMRSYAAKFAREMDFIPREEFEVVEAMAKKAREENENLKKRIELLEKNAVSKNKAKSAKIKNSPVHAKKKSVKADQKKTKKKKGTSNAAR